MGGSSLVIGQKEGECERVQSPCQAPVTYTAIDQISDCRINTGQKSIHPAPL